MKQYYLVLILILLSVQHSLAMAEDFHVVISGTANHLGHTRYNEKNWGLGFEYDFEERNKWIPFLTGSRFLDSNKNWSNYLGGGTKRRFLLQGEREGLHLDLGVVGFLMTRIDYKEGKPFPGALPFASVGNQWIAINATYVPKIDPKMVQFFYFQLMLKVAEF